MSRSTRQKNLCRPSTTPTSAKAALVGDPGYGTPPVRTGYLPRAYAHG
jgi:hypothetical protein